MAISQVPPLSSNVPIVYPPGHPSAGCPTPAFATLMQILLDEKAITDALAAGAIQPGTVTTSGLTAAAQRILGNKEAITGAIEELTLSQVLDLIGSAAQGDLLVRGSAGWQRLAAGTSGQFLKTLGSGADPAWATPSSSGGATSGSWTPTMNFGGGSTGLTYTKQLGFYVRVGKLVTIWFDLQLNAKGTSTGNVYIGGLPFNASTTVNQISAPMWLTNGTSINARAWFGTASGAATATQFGLRANTTTLTAFTNSNIGTTGDEIIATLQYITDDA